MFTIKMISLGLVIGIILGIIFIILIDAKAIINDTLKNPKTQQWSRKNITGFICMVCAIYYCLYGLIYDKTIQEFVVAIFVGASLTCLGISSWEKANINKINKDEDEKS
jgi:hypothetical protein